MALSLEERLADLISGGGIRARDGEIKRLNALIEKLRVTADHYRQAAKSADSMLGCFKADVDMLSEALNDIIDMETPDANATVRRMAARARDVL